MDDLYGRIRVRVSDFFLQGLGESGYIAGQNIAIEEGYYGADADKLRTPVDQFVRAKVDVIFVAGSQAALAAKRAAAPTR